MLYFCFVIVLIRSASGFFEDLDARETSLSYFENDAAAASEPLTVPLTLIQGADSKGAGNFYLFVFVKLCIEF